MELSKEGLDRLTRKSVDPSPRGTVVRKFHNVDLTDEDLVQRIEKRNKECKPTYLLRMEYQRRLNQRQPDNS